MLITTSSIFTIIAANKKAESLKSVMDNLGFRLLDSMTRNISTVRRTVHGYSGPLTASVARLVFIWFQSSFGSPTVEYYLSGGRIWQNESDWTGGALPITAAEINVGLFTFILLVQIFTTGFNHASL